MPAPKPTSPKHEWRDWAKQTRASRDRDAVSGAIVGHLADWDRLQSADVILTYLPKQEEVDLTGLAEAFSPSRLAVTRTPASGPLSVHPFTGPRERHRLGFDQPVPDAPVIPIEAVDVALVPGLVFDISGARLGWGVGYYDRLLGELASGALRVGVAMDELVVATLPQDEWDVPMTHVATEAGVAAAIDYPPATIRVIGAAAERGLAIRPIVFEEGTKTSADAATQAGCELSAIAKSIVFTVDGEAVVVILSGDHRVDTVRLAAVLDAHDVRRASLEEARAATGFAAGGTPAFGYPHPLTVLIDESLRRHEDVWSAAGTPTTVYPIKLADLVQVSGGSFADIGH